MASAFIVTRKASTGRRFVVRYRLGGRAWPIQHGGSFQTLREARARRDLIGGELAAGRNPADVLQAMVERPQVRTFSAWADVYRVSRPDIGDETRKNMLSHLKRLEPAFGERDPATITASDVQEWIGSAMGDLKPSSLKRYVSTLRAVLDFAGVDPNPARSVKLPKIESAIVEPPTAAQVDAIIQHSPRRWHLPLRVLEQTGMRVGELRDLNGATSTWPRAASASATARRPRRAGGLRFPVRSWTRSPRRARRTTALLSVGSSSVSRPTWPRTLWPAPARRPASRTSTRTTSATATRASNFARAFRSPTSPRNSATRRSRSPSTSTATFCSTDRAETARNACGGAAAGPIRAMCAAPHTRRSSRYPPDDLRPWGASARDHFQRPQ
jgi:hypothetical protein